MNNKLVEIVNYKKEFVKQLKPVELKRAKPILNPLTTLSDKPIIAEYKRSSPSAGNINDSVSVEDQVIKYEKFGAGMVSVLTDEKFFSGSYEYLHRASQVLTIPTLCKDFIISEIQIDYAYNNGADAILLIAAILDDNELKRLVDYSKKLSLKILLEIHTEEEYKRVRGLDVDMLGVNSRNLDTFIIDKNYAAKLIEKVKHDFIVAESGIEDENDVRFFKKAGAKAFLIGTSLMKAPDTEQFIKKLYKGLENVC